VKAADTVQGADLRGLKTLRDQLGGRLARGVLLHGGRDVVPLGERLCALPQAHLWQTPAPPPES
jgi:hypothetical protein